MGGAQQLLIKLCNSLDSGEYKHIVICLSGETVLASKLRNIGVSVYCLDMNGIFFSIQAIWKLRCILKLEKPHLVHTWLYHADFVTTVAMIGMKLCPLVWSIHHANEKFDGDKKVTKWLVKLLALMSNRFPKVIIYCSEYARKVHFKLGYKPQSDIVINNGIDTKRFSPSISLRTKFREELGIEKNTFLIGMVARYSPVKGYKIFLDMASELLEKNNNIKFVMIGTNVVKTNLELVDAMDRLEISEYSLLLGERTDIETAMNGMDVLVCPSLAESFGLVVIEALACEVPVVCSNLEALLMIVGENYIVPIGEPRLFADKVNELISLTQKDRQVIGCNGRENMRKKFNDISMIEKYRNIYNEITTTHIKYS